MKTILKKALALQMTVLLHCACPGARIGQAAIADAVLAWGNNNYGQTTIG